MVGHCRDFAAVVLFVALAGAITVMAFSAALDMAFSEAIAMGPAIAAVIRSAAAMRGFFTAASATAATRAFAATRPSRTWPRRHPGLRRALLHRHARPRGGGGGVYASSWGASG